MTGAGRISTDASTTLTYGGIITDSGALTKIGEGTLILTGENTLTGLTTISEGTLVAGTEDNEGDSILAGNVAVSGGVLSGGGTIDGNVTYSSSAGTLAPGNSIGTLTISGNLTLSADDTTKIEFNKTKADKIVVGGNTTLAGTISLYPEDVQYDEIQFTIVDASSGGNFTGTFGTETMNNESYLNSSSWDISYDTVNKKVFLDLGGSDTCNIECTTTEDKFKDIAKVFDSATSGTFKEVGDILDSADTSSVRRRAMALFQEPSRSRATQPMCCPQQVSPAAAPQRERFGSLLPRMQPVRCLRSLATPRQIHTLLGRTLLPPLTARPSGCAPRKR